MRVLADLYMPFAQLVQGQWRHNFPLVRVAFVLTAGASGPSESADLRRRRIYLAAAMETLRLALGVHTQLLLSETPADLDRSLLGGTVLAGDFCFSRSAGLAAKTGSPVIVDLFASALQRVSEGSLRRLFRPSELPYDKDRGLCLSGVAAANELARLAPPGAASWTSSLGLACWMRITPGQSTRMAHHTPNWRQIAVPTGRPLPPGCTLSPASFLP